MPDCHVYLIDKKNRETLKLCGFLPVEDNIKLRIFSTIIQENRIVTVCKKHINFHTTMCTNFLLIDLHWIYQHRFYKCNAQSLKHIYQKEIDAFYAHKCVSVLTHFAHIVCMKIDIFLHIVVQEIEIRGPF